MKGDTRTALWARLGCVPKNVHWAWCGRNPTDKSVVFHAWVDRMKGREYLFFDTEWVNSQSPGGADALDAIHSLENDEWTLYITTGEAVDTTAEPRKIKRINDTTAFLCSWREENGKYYATPAKRITI